MKRLASQPITTFFQRKQTRRISIESVDSDASAQQRSTSDQVEAIDDEAQEQQDEKEEQEEQSVARRSAAASREDVTSILKRRELVGCASTWQLVGGLEGSRRRRKQQLVRWALTHFRRLPVELQLAPHWERQAGALRGENFYASCLEFDAQGVLLAAGASNGIIALYDFDDAFHRSLNLGQRMDKERGVKNGEEEGGEKEIEDEIVHPIHTIFTPFEVKCIRWNPLNEDEIACSYSNRNEIHVFDLRKFPSKPHKVLKSSSHPSSGYNDLLFLPAPEVPQLQNPRRVGVNAKPRPRTSNVIAGDMDGAIRMWDPRSPLRPGWSFLTGSHPINSLMLSPNKQFLICGNEAGMLMTYDIKNTVVPAFGSKPVPQRKASVSIMEAIKPYLPPAYIDAVLLSSRFGSPGITSMRLVQHSETQVLCQLRNDWVVVIDYFTGSVVKLHTFIRGLAPREKSRAVAAPSVLSAASEGEHQRDFLPNSLRNSWLSCHRCSATLLFDESIMCTGIHDASSLNVIDLHQLRRIESSATARTNEGTNDLDKKNPINSGLPTLERLDRFRIPMNSIVTAVAAHPNEHSVICGGENMRLQVMGVFGVHDKR